jgi:hypothetical protein
MIQWQGATQLITMTKRIHCVLFGMQNRTLGPYLATLHSVHIPVVHVWCDGLCGPRWLLSALVVKRGHIGGRAVFLQVDGRVYEAYMQLTLNPKQESDEYTFTMKEVKQTQASGWRWPPAGLMARQPLSSRPDRTRMHRLAGASTHYGSRPLSPNSDAGDVSLAGPILPGPLGIARRARSATPPQPAQNSDGSGIHSERKLAHSGSWHFCANTPEPKRATQ